MHSEPPTTPARRWGDLLLRYGTAVAATLVAWIVRLALGGALHDRSRFLTFIAASALVSLYFGLGPGLIPLVLGAVIGSISPPPQPGEAAAVLWSLLLYFVSGACIAVAGHSLRQTRVRLAAAVARAEQASSALGETEERYRLLAEALPHMVWTTDFEKGYEFRNNKLFEYTGLSAEEAHGDGWLNAVHPDDVPQTRERIERAKRAGEPCDLECRFRRASDGQYRWHIGRKVPVREASGRVTCWIGAVMDVHDMRETQHALHESREMLSTTLRSIGDAVLVADEQGRVTFMNPVAEELTAWPESDAIGRDSREVFHIVNERTGELVESPIERVLREGIVVGLANHTVLIARDGTRRPIDDSGAPIRDEQGNSQGAVLVFRDISERRGAEIAVAEQQGRLAGIVDSAMDAIITVDASQHVVVFNKAAERMFGCPSVMAIGRPLDQFLPDRFRHLHAGYIRNFGETGTTSRSMGSLGTVTALRSDGSEFPIEATISQAVAGGQKLYTVIMRDVTDRLQADSELRERQREIESLNARLRRSMAETHHRVKNNLQLICALVELQTLQHDDFVPVDELRRMAHHVRSLAAIHDLLTYEAKSDEDLEWLSARAALTRLLPMIRESVGGRPFSWKLDDVRMPVRQGTSLVVVVNELVSNAVKHGRGGIQLTLSVNHETAQLAISDGGSGFPPGFDPLTAAGTGLELVESVSRWDLQGSTRYETIPNGGARVVITFPVEQRAESMAPLPHVWPD